MHAAHLHACVVRAPLLENASDAIQRYDDVVASAKGSGDSLTADIDRAIPQ